MEQMKPKEARRVLRTRNAAAEVPLREVEISEKTIHVEGQDILLQLVRPARVKRGAAGIHVLSRRWLGAGRFPHP